MTTSIKQVQRDYFGIPSTPYSISSATSVILTNPCPSLINASFSAAGQYLQLPKMNSSDSIGQGESITIVNTNKFNSFDIKLHDATTTLYSTLPPLASITLTLVANSSNGSWSYPALLNGERIVLVYITTSYEVDPLLDCGKVFFLKIGGNLTLQQASGYADTFYFYAKAESGHVASITPFSGDFIDDQSPYGMEPLVGVKVFKATASLGSNWFVQAKTIPTTGAATYDSLTLTSLTPSQAVVTDSSKKLVSLAYATTNTASSLVERDSSGNFSAGTITATLTGNASTVTNGVYTTDTGTVTNTMLAGSIANAKLANSSVTINGTPVALGASGTVTASTTAALTISSGLQLNSGSTFDGSTAKTLTIDSTVATLSGTQTLTNKTEMNPVLISGSTTYTTGTASQSTTTVTGSGTTFTSDMVGGLIVFSGGQTAWVQGFISTTSLQCLPSQSVSSTSYTLYYNGVQMDSHGNIGLQTGNAKTYLTSPTFTDVTDKTKTATISLSSQTTGTNSVIVTDTLTQTLTNKTLTSPTLSSTTTFANGATVRTGTTAADSYSLGAYGAGSGTYKAFVTFTNDGPIGAVPQCVIAAPSGGVLTIDGATIGSTTSANATVNTLTVKNGFISPPRIVTASGAITISSSDYAVVSNKTVGAATTVNLPAPGSAGQIYIIKDGKGDAGTNNITLTPASGNIDGASTFVMNINYQSITLLDNGTQYNIL